MKRIISLVIALFLVFGSTFSPVLAKPAPAKSDIITELQKKPQTKVLTDKELFTVMVNVIAEYGEIPASYKNIEVKKSWEIPGSRIYDAYQKALYMDILKPSQIPVKFTGKATHKKMVKYTNLFYGEKVNGVVLVDGSKLTAIQKNLTYNDLLFYAANYLGSKSADSPVQNAPGFEILADAYNKLVNEHIDNATFDHRNLIYGAIQGMTEATDDPYSAYFPPIEAKEFNEGLSGAFEGIGTYVDMSKPGEFIITSPLPGSPAEKAWIKWGDRVMKVDGWEITKTSSANEVVSKIKWPSGTSVTLEILRGTETLTITVVRAKIIIDEVTYQKIDSNISLIQITFFGNEVEEQFKKAIDQVAADNPKRVIIDLRSNPGGDVAEVSKMLNYFVPAHENKFTAKSLTNNEVYLSTGEDTYFKGREIVILINKGTASASEIMTTVIQDYLGAQTKVVGETSYGKGCMQSLYPYSDGSSLKYTIANWYTGKTNRSINKVGIIPDHAVELDIEKFKAGTDTQLEFAKTVGF